MIKKLCFYVYTAYNIYIYNIYVYIYVCVYIYIYINHIYKYTSYQTGPDFLGMQHSVFFSRAHILLSYIYIYIYSSSRHSPCLFYI